MIMASFSFTILFLLSFCLTNTVSTSAPTECSQQPYKIHIFSRRPLLIYIEDFVSLSEAKELITLAEPSYLPSEVVSPLTSEEGSRTISPNTTARHSESTALYSNTSPLIDCIRSRAASFQGISPSRLEPLQVVRYAPNGFFKHHYDWLSSAPACSADDFCEQGMGDRESTFFVYLQADCEGGETDFVSLDMPPYLDEELWGRFVEWEGEGVRWKPKAGAAVFWENLDENGDGMGSVLHAGLPVREGSKIGLNIWTRQRVPGPCNGEYKCEREVEEGQLEKGEVQVEVDQVEKDQSAVPQDLTSSPGHEEL